MCIIAQEIGSLTNTVSLREQVVSGEECEEASGERKVVAKGQEPSRRAQPMFITIHKVSAEPERQQPKPLENKGQEQLSPVNVGSSQGSSCQRSSLVT